MSNSSTSDLDGHLRDVDVRLTDFGNEIQLAGAIYCGKDRHFYLYFPEEREAWNEHNSGKANQSWMYLTREDWERMLRQTDLIETEVTTKLQDGTVVKAIARKSQRQIDQVVSWEVYRRDGYRCRYCANDKTPLTVDHIILWEDRGPTTAENLLTACRPCNKTRGRTPYADWLHSSYYQRVSRNLPFAVQEDNEAIIDRLDKIPRVAVARSR